MNVIAHSDLSITVILHQCSWLVISDVLARISNVVLSVDSNQCHFHLPSPLITGSIPEQDGDRIYNTLYSVWTQWRPTHYIQEGIVVCNIVAYRSSFLPLSWTLGCVFSIVHKTTSIVHKHIKIEAFCRIMFIQGDSTLAVCRIVGIV